MMLDNNIVTSPDKVIFSNWKRLDESGWTLNVKDGRNFNLLPYSINDSAVSHYYEPIRIPQGGKPQVFYSGANGKISVPGGIKLEQVEAG